MSVKWSWAWGDGAVETPAVMAADMGFAYSSTNAAVTTIDSLNTYTYAGSPTRYSLRMDNFMTVDMPGGVADIRGWICIPVYVTAATGLQGNRKLIRLWGTGLPGNPEIYLTLFGGPTTASSIGLWIAGVNVATSANIDWLTTWNYVALKFDASIAPNWTASVWVNGAEVISNQTQAATPTNTFDLQFTALSGGDREWTIGQVVVYDDPADAGQTPRFCTRINPTVDIPADTVGTWAPSTGVDNWAVVDSPFSTSTYTSNGTAASGDKFVCTAGNFTALLGVAPGVVDGVTLHDWSSGSGASIFAAVGESTGPTYTNGTPITPSGASSYAYATAPTNPAAGDWAAANTVVVKHEVS